MMEAQLIRIIKKTVREEFARILLGTTVSNEDQFRTTVQRPGEGPIGGMRKILPYGLASRAPTGTPAFVVPIDGNATHLNTVGDFDLNRPSLGDGETILYDQFGHIVYLSQTKIQIGSKTSAQNLVLGQVFKAMMDSLLQALSVETHVSGPPGFPTSVPINASSYTALKASPIDDNAILSDKAFTEK